MADTAAPATPTAAASASPKKAKAAKPKKPRTTPNHPKVAEMVNAAITNLKERGGSSLQAIKKYIAGNYKADVEKISPFIKKYLKSAVANGTLIQTKGKGASGSFKLGASLAKKDKKEKPKKAKPAAVVAEKKKVAKPKKSIEKKKVAKPKKAAKKAEKPKSPKKAKSPKKVKSPKKEKKAKSPKKPKSPKPKKAAAKKTGKK